VQVKESERHLNHPVEDLVFGEILAFAGFDLAVNISTITVNHDNVEILFPVNIAILISHDV
jgi:hypothetical protein